MIKYVLLNGTTVFCFLFLSLERLVSPERGYKTKIPVWVFVWEVTTPWVMLLNQVLGDGGIREILNRLVMQSEYGLM